MRSPGYALVINWISQAWDELDTDVIENSFKLCGITQSNMSACHTQLRAFVEEGERDMVVDDDGTNEIRGFGNEEDFGSDDDGSEGEESELESGSDESE